MRDLANLSYLKTMSGKVDNIFFIKKANPNIIIIQVYAYEITFGTTNDI